jgi:hypothetical protein
VRNEIRCTEPSEKSLRTRAYKLRARLVARKLRTIEKDYLVARLREECGGSASCRPGSYHNGLN